MRITVKKIPHNVSRHAESLKPVRPVERHADSIGAALALSTYTTSHPNVVATLNEDKRDRHAKSRQQFRQAASHQFEDSDWYDTLPTFERMR